MTPVSAWEKTSKDCRDGHDTFIQLDLNFFLRSIDWVKAEEFYRKILSENRNEKNSPSESTAYSDTNSDFDSDYVIISRIGEMYMEGKYGIEKNPQEASDLFMEAADLAVHFGKGRLANKYFEMSDKALAMIE